MESSDCHQAEERAECTQVSCTLRVTLRYVPVTSTDQPEEGELDNFLRSHRTVALEQNHPTWSLTPLSSPQPTSKFSLPGLTSLLSHTLSALAPQCFEKFLLYGQRKFASSPSTPLTWPRAASLLPSGLSHPICPMTQS